ncbi:hypothetical protein B0H34DRAFT_737437 [Crassisporium funariophilum]|nr:hypothetical protein B0H34DRAFT_737437 [Crassisporium funariophilum]
MVKGVARSSGGASSSSNPSTHGTSPPQQLPTMQTGQNVHDPLTQLNSHAGFGAMAGLNPFGDMGLNASDPNMMQSMLSSPQFLEQMSRMMSNPAVIDQVIASNPQLAAMGPQVRQAFQDEGFRQMVSNPESLQQMLQMASMFQGQGGGGGFGGGGFGGGAFGAPPPAFPAPGTPNTLSSSTTPSTTSTTSPTSPPAPSTTGPPMNPFSMFGAGFPPPAAGAGAGSPGGAATPGAFNPALMQQMMGMGMGNPYGGWGAPPAAPAAPADTRSPEERFQVQLQQLQDMGFTNAAQNVRALLATAGNVQGAIDYIFSGNGI